jgi:hypothetical protein
VGYAGPPGRRISARLGSVTRCNYQITWRRSINQLRHTASQPISTLHRPIVIPAPRAAHASDAALTCISTCMLSSHFPQATTTDEHSLIVPSQTHPEPCPFRCPLTHGRLRHNATYGLLNGSCLMPHASIDNSNNKNSNNTSPRRQPSNTACPHNTQQPPSSHF